MMTILAVGFPFKNDLIGLNKTKAGVKMGLQFSHSRITSVLSWDYNRDIFANDKFFT